MFPFDPLKKIENLLFSDVLFSDVFRGMKGNIGKKRVNVSSEILEAIP